MLKTIFFERIIRAIFQLNIGIHIRRRDIMQKKMNNNIINKWRSYFPKILFSQLLK